MLNYGDLVVHDNYHAIVVGNTTLALSNGVEVELSYEEMSKCWRLGLYNGSSAEQIGSPANFREWLEQRGSEFPVTWVYRLTEPNLWTVGFYDPRGTWHTDSDHPDKEEAGKRAHYLNGARHE